MMASRKPVSKKVINSPETCVDDNLRGVVAMCPGLHLHPKHRVITLRRKVKLFHRTDLTHNLSATFTFHVGTDLKDTYRYFCETKHVKQKAMVNPAQLAGLGWALA